MAYETEKRDAQAQITEAAQGATVSIRRTEATAYDPITDVTTLGAAQIYVVPGVELPIGANDVSNLPGFRIASAKAQVLVAALDLPEDFEPRAEDAIWLAGRSVAWTILDVQPLRPSGEPIMYTLYVSDGIAQ